MSNSNQLKGQATVQLQLTIEQAQAVAHALDAYSRLCIGQLEEVVKLVQHEVIPCQRDATRSGLRQVAAIDQCEQIEFLMQKVKQVLGYPSNGSNGIGHPDVHVTGLRAYEIKKVLDQALAVHRDPNPSFRGVNYDGLGPRYTPDPAPVAIVSA